MYPKSSTKEKAIGLLMWMLPLFINRCSALLLPKEAKSNFLTLPYKKNHKNQGVVVFIGFFEGTSASYSSTKVSLFVGYVGDSIMSWLNDLIVSHIHYRSLMKATTSLGRQTRTLPKLPRSSILMGINKRYLLIFVCVIWHGCFFMVSSYDCVVIFLRYLSEEMTSLEVTVENANPLWRFYVEDVLFPVTVTSVVLSSYWKKVSSYWWVINLIVIINLLSQTPPVLTPPVLNIATICYNITLDRWWLPNPHGRRWMSWRIE